MNNKEINDAIDLFKNEIDSHKFDNFINYIFDNFGYNGIATIYYLFNGDRTCFIDGLAYLDNLYYYEDGALYTKDKHILLGLASLKDKVSNQITVIDSCNEIHIRRGCIKPIKISWNI